MFDKERIRNLLIDDAHSDQGAKAFFESKMSDEDLLHILIKLVFEDYSGDVRMEAAYWISQFNTDLLRKVEGSLLKAQEDEWDSVACHIIVALGKIKSVSGLKYLIERRIQPELYWEAIALKYHLGSDQN